MKFLLQSKIYGVEIGLLSLLEDEGEKEVHKVGGEIAKEQIFSCWKKWDFYNLKRS